MLETLPPPRFDYGAEVRVIRNLRNDGTHPGSDKGTLLVRRGATGIVRDVGTFLQDQVIYTVHFTLEDLIVGCRDKELIPADAPWVPNRFEFGDKVKAKVLLALQAKWWPLLATGERSSKSFGMTRSSKPSAPLPIMCVFPVAHCKCRRWRWIGLWQKNWSQPHERRSNASGLSPHDNVTGSASMPL